MSKACLYKAWRENQHIRKHIILDLDPDCLHQHRDQPCDIWLRQLSQYTENGLTTSLNYNGFTIIFFFQKAKVHYKGFGCCSEEVDQIMYYMEKLFSRHCWPRLEGVILEVSGVIQKMGSSCRIPAGFRRSLKVAEGTPQIAITWTPFPPCLRHSLSKPHVICLPVILHNV